MKEINSIIRVNENCSCDISRKTAAVAFCCQKGKMDNKKAIEWLKAISAAQSNSLNKNSLTDRKEALHMAIQALTKAEPKKPVIYSDTNRADCPVCGAAVRGIKEPFGDWCSRCGQVLDWGDSVTVPCRKP